MKHDSTADIRHFRLSVRVDGFIAALFEGQSVCFHPRFQILICRCVAFPAGITDFVPVTENHHNVIVSSVLVNPHFFSPCSDDKVFVEKHSAELIRITPSCSDSFALAAGQRPNLSLPPPPFFFFLQPE